MNLRGARSTLLIALTALAFGFLLAGQLRLQLIAPANRVARNEALVRSVQDLERANAAYRGQIAATRLQISRQEAEAATRSELTRRLQDQVVDLRTHAGLTPLHGPGVIVEIGSGRPGSGADASARTAHLVNFEDIQDVVNLLFQGGAEGVAVNGRRVSPLTGFRGSEGAILIDQGSPILSPYRINAVGNRSQMEQLLGDPSRLGDLRSRVTRYGVQFSYSGSPEVTLPAYDSSLQVVHATPQQ